MLLPTLLQLLMLYRVWTSLYHFAGLYQGCSLDNLLFWIFWVESFFPFLFITNKALCFFPFLGKLLHFCGYSVPSFIAFFCCEFLYGFSWVVHLSGFSHKPTVLEFCLDLFLSQFSISGCKVLLFSSFFLDTFLQHHWPYCIAFFGYRFPFLGAQFGFYD